MQKSLPWAAVVLVGACAPPAMPPSQPLPLAPAHQLAPYAVIPRPESIELTGGARFRIDTTTIVVVDAGATPEVDRLARSVVAMLSPFVSGPPRAAGRGDPAARGSIRLRVTGEATSEPEEYALIVTADSVTLSAATPHGLFNAIQTMRQLLPVAVEHSAALRRSLSLPAVRVGDSPRFSWRGAMLDVSRHFLAARDVKRFIDLMALHKLNRLHLHLADDQGWRIEVKSWPNLARHGGSTQVGGGPGGYYTQPEFADIVAYAAERFITVVPEIDMPGHTNAALASYAELNCDDVARPLYTGTRVGFSALCVERDTVYRFVSDVVREIGAIATGPWFHIGGDEVERLTDEQYRRFVERVERIVRSHGKTMIGWGDVAPASLDAGTIVQFWRRDSSQVHARRGGKFIMSPAWFAYLDMKYDTTTVLGLNWAAYIEVRNAYTWEPGAVFPGIPESAILGVEAPLWSETVVKLEDFEYLAFPRLAAIAEVGWSPAAARDWDDFRLRLGAHGARLAALGVNFYRSPQIPWSP